jgi:hypothetical protein
MLTMSATTFARTLDEVHRFASTDKVLTAINAVNLEVTPGGVLMVATDLNRLLAGQVTVVDGDDPDAAGGDAGSTCIPLREAKALLKTLRDRGCLRGSSPALVGVRRSDDGVWEVLVDGEVVFCHNSARDASFPWWRATMMACLDQDGESATYRGYTRVSCRFLNGREDVDLLAQTARPNKPSLLVNRASCGLDLVGMVAPIHSFDQDIAPTVRRFCNDAAAPVGTTGR